MTTGAIVPVHGFPAYLAETLDAVLVNEPDVVVVVDDASPEALVLHPDHAAHVTLVRREHRGGPASARETGLAALPADVELVALCDADDTWEPGLLTAHRAALAARPDAGLAFGRATIVGADGRPTGERWKEPPAGELVEPALALYSANPIPTSSVVVRRSALEAAGGFASPVPVAEDWDLWLRVAATGAALLCVPEARVRYRRHPGGLTADVSALANSQLALHDRHADLVDAGTRTRARTTDRRALRRDRLRRRLRRLV